MVIENRDLAAGTRLVANYKKVRYVCTIEADEDGKTAFVLEDGRRFKSPSAAASAVMGGQAANGWRFWSLEGAAPAVEATEAVEAPQAKTGRAKGKKMIYRVPNQLGTPEGKAKFFCSACMKGFLVEAGTTPDACPEGHRIDDAELTAPVATPAVETEAD